MQQIPIEIYKRMNRQGKPSDVFVSIAYTLMGNLNMSFEEVKNLPFPMALELLSALNKEHKKMEKAYKRKR